MRRPKAEDAVQPAAPADLHYSRCGLSEVWADFNKPLPDFFGDLHIAKDGGFSEIEVMLEPRRFLAAVLSSFSLVLNLFFIVYPNVQILVDRGGDDQVEAKAMISNYIWGAVAPASSAPKPKIVLACLELGMLVFYTGKALVAIPRILRKQEASRWHAWSYLLWDTIPTLSSFSAMKSLHYITPKILIPATLHCVKKMRRAGSKYGLHLLGFFALRLFYAFVGFEAFVIKFSLAANTQETATSFLGAAGSALAFLNQMLGVVDVGRFASRRLFVFIFGGEDGFMDDREELVAQTFLAMLCRRVWHATATLKKKPRWLWFLAATLSYTDDQFQTLVLNETEPMHRQPRKPKKVSASAEVEGSSAAPVSTFHESAIVEPDRGKGELSGIHGPDFDVSESGASAEAEV